MNTKHVKSLIILGLSFGQAAALQAGAFYVAPAPLGSDDGPGTETQPFATIQKGINIAAEGDTVIAAAGTYFENITLKGKDLIVRSADPDNTNVVANTILDGSSMGSVITFSGTETPACVLEGFTIQHGCPDFATGGYGGGICGGATNLHTRATIRNNIICHNWSTYGGGLAFCDGEIVNNRISLNGAYPDGGGLYDCDSTIRSNTIADNWGPEDGEGGGLHGCDGLIEQNLIQGNRMYNGGGLAYCQGTIRQNVIVGNIGEYGAGAIYGCDGLIQNNVVAFNGGWEAGGLECCSGAILNNTIAANFGLGLLGCQADIRNCIIWGNTVPGGLQLSESSQAAYCCIENWSAGGEGNFDFYPHFVDLGHTNLHLQSWSPCLDAGDPTSAFANEPVPNGDRIDLGAYGNMADTASRSADTDADDLPDDWEIFWFSDLAQDGSGDPDDDFFPNSTEYHYGRDPTSIAGKAARNLTKRIAYFTIQAALANADHGDEIEVNPGRYEENLWFDGRNVVLRSLAPDDPSVVSATVIAAVARGPVVSFAGTEDTNCILAGFTLCDGLADQGAGILGGALEHQTHAAILNNIITNNSARFCGGGLACCAGLIQSNRFEGNYATSSGGAIYGCSGGIVENLIAHNVAHTGGGLAECTGALEANVISNNIAYEGNGGGAALCPALIRRNTLLGNTATVGGGLFYCNGSVEQNVIAANSAYQDGGGLADCHGSLVNNTMAGNSAGKGGGGLYGCTSAIVNCIIWGNTAWEGPALYASSVPTYSCIQDWTGGGEGNHAYAPYFTDVNAGDYHLRSWSPCVDAGDPGSPFANEPQPNGGRIDQGAYGNTAGATPKSIDSDSDRLPDAWEMLWFTNLTMTATSDPDGDFLNNEVEYLYGRNPLSSAENQVRNLTQSTGHITIHSALAAAVPGDELVVYPGVYSENVRFAGKSVVLRSSAPLDANVVAQTVIDGQERGPVITFAGTENTNCVVAGFTIRNGRADEGGAICGSISNRTHATLRSNIITACVAPSGRGGGVAYCDGFIEYNSLLTNTGSALYDCDGTVQANYIAGQQKIWSDDSSGPGLEACDGLITSNTILGNTGDGLRRCHGTVQGNTITGNRFNGIWDCDGLIQNNRIVGNIEAGLYACSGTIQNNLVTGKAGQESGGGIRRCLGTIQNNTVVPLLPGQAGMDRCEGVIRNCIVWANFVPAVPLVSGCTPPTACCIQGWTGGGDGNLTNFPQFLDLEGGDYHLGPTSPCIDHGRNFYWFAWPQHDLDGLCRLAGQAVDIGCYEFNSGPDTDGDLWCDADELEARTRPDQEDTDGDGLRDGLEALRQSDPLQATAPRLVQISSDLLAIQAALCLGVQGDEIVVSPNTFGGNLQFCGADVTLRSVDPARPELTILDGQGTGPAVSFSGKESGSCSLAGFTVQNGVGYFAGGVRGNGTHATLQHNLFTHNAAWHGGGVYGCNGLIQDNTFTANSARDNGGGLAQCQGTIRNNTIAGNEASELGGGLAECQGLIENNRIQGNLGYEGGGGVYGCNGVVRNNWVEGNTVHEGGGGGFASCLATIQNNLILRNSAIYGGGLSRCLGAVQNNTIFGNNAGAVAFCTNPIVNCIIWGNWGGLDGETLYMSAVPSHSCIQAWTGGGDGNTASDPQFVNPAGNDLRLLASSPCVDMGDNSAPNLAVTDFFGRPRILDGGHSRTVDLGAYELWATACAIGPKPDLVTLSWGSLDGKTYTIFWSPDLSTWQAADQVRAAGNLTTAWIDDGSRTGSPPGSAPHRFYHWVENP